ncbi:MAG TPA: catalase [Gammaproteobacteria bacterium]|nr:catalase [Gammaproteobacteria bacterium]
MSKDASKTLNDNAADVTLTYSNGAPVPNNDDSLQAGSRQGPVLMQDIWLTEKMANFNRERIPERVVHAKGSGAYGTFTVTQDISKWTKAKMFAEVGKQTECLVRFSQVAGERGFPDVYRDVRGFAVKFYTEEGNWDLVGNNTPIFFVRDPIKFMDFIHSQKRLPGQALRSPTMQWDFWSLHPESIHQVTWLMGDRGLPKSYRHMNGYSSHTFSFINEANERVWMKIHLKSRQGVENLTEQEGQQVRGEDGDAFRRDLYDAIADGDFPQWTMFCQVMTAEQAESFPWDPFDLTKVWPHGDFPLHEIGVMELNRNPDSFHVDIEQSAFSPANLVPGISYSPDPMLQARLMSYPDAHRYRLGVNNYLLPPNRTRACPMHTYHRDGFMRFDANGGQSMPYTQNSFPGPTADPAHEELPMPVPPGPARRFDHREGYDDYGQVRVMYERVMDEPARERLIENVVSNLAQTPEQVQRRMLEVLRRVCDDYADRVAKGLASMADAKPAREAQQMNA